MTLSRTTLADTIQNLLRQWPRNGDSEVMPLTHLRLYRELARQTVYPAKPVETVRQLLEHGLAELHIHEPDIANLLRWRYFEDRSAQEMCQQLNISESHYYKMQQKALTQLTEMILDQEYQAQTEHRLAVEARLEPLTYHRLYGVESLREQLRAAIEQPGEPWIVALDGLGGIGKTSLADELVRAVVLESPFYNIGWVSARQRTFLPAVGLHEMDRPALDIDTLVEAALVQFGQPYPPTATTPEKTAILTKLLKTQPYLVVIDNLETITDYQALLPLLRRLANPTKFLLTSRHSLCGYSDVFCLSLKELSQEATLAFLQHEAEVRGLRSLLEATPAQFEQIYRVVGGNPLALKLIVGQVCVLPLSQVLENLEQAEGKRIGDLYNYIYRQTWQALSPLNRHVLLAMPLITGQGGSFAQLKAITELSAVNLSQALEELVSFSIVEVGGDIEHRRYRIHRLTETFLLTEVTRWQDPSEIANSE